MGAPQSPRVGRWGFAMLDVPEPSVRNEGKFAPPPRSVRAAVSQYRLSPRDLEVRLSGAMTPGRSTPRAVGVTKLVVGATAGSRPCTAPTADSPRQRSKGPSRPQTQGSPRSASSAATALDVTRLAQAALRDVREETAHARPRTTPNTGRPVLAVADLALNRNPQGSHLSFRGLAASPRRAVSASQGKATAHKPPAPTAASSPRSARYLRDTGFSGGLAGSYGTTAYQNEPGLENLCQAWTQSVSQTRHQRYVRSCADFNWIRERREHSTYWLKERRTEDDERKALLRAWDAATLIQICFRAARKMKQSHAAKYATRGEVAAAAHWYSRHRGSRTPVDINKLTTKIITTGEVHGWKSTYAKAHRRHVHASATTLKWEASHASSTHQLPHEASNASFVASSPGGEEDKKATAAAGTDRARSFVKKERLPLSTPRRLSLCNPATKLGLGHVHAAGEERRAKALTPRKILAFNRRPVTAPAPAPAPVAAAH
mmetsp:Transcript_3392/g.12182  ORF Transcript_3392/g.12182 Transcript_3392/m.12182 type:complete len:488 (+) Transcript_3392:1-1464(+)